MKNWADLKLRTKQLVLISACCVVMLVIGGMGMLGMKTLQTHLGESNESLHHVALLGQMKSDFLVMRLDLVYILASKDPATLKAKLDDFSKKSALVREAIKVFESSELEASEKEQLNIFKTGFEEYFAKGKPLAESILTARESSDEVTVESASGAIVKQVAPLYTKPGEAIAALVDYNIKESQTSYEADVKKYHRDMLLMVVIVCGATIFAFILGFVIYRSIAGPLAQVIDTMALVAAGDLTAHSSINSRDEMGQLAAEINEMVDKLRAIISQISSTSTQVASASSQLHSTADRIATGSEEVAAQAGTVATAGEEMSATSGDIAQNCQMAAEGAHRASQAASDGAAVVERTVAVMGQIAEKVQESARTVESLGARSDQIGAIIGTIEDIADQTNLLALNAAIEAARAGEQGRGFAVVADEVRALAERTTRATKEIGEMIKAIQRETKGAVIAMEQGVQQVENGTEEAAKSGQALQDILAQVNDVAMQVNQIATAAEEQTATTSEISNNMQQITEVVQQTSQGAHESATAAAQLSGNAEELQRLVHQFKL
ncbi:MAG: methyl-accepting chemotaxis protein [Geobacteraceae bacterium]|nr:methyl-accepting chemotaxis protein [Geobacteraceae bacterium]NTW79682.1 methyl-accepting chemotaxis protein [Geobacteraceae bacterium]